MDRGGQLGLFLEHNIKITTLHQKTDHVGSLVAALKGAKGGNFKANIHRI